MQVGMRARWEPMRTLAFGGISANYAAVGTPLANPCNQLIINNLTDVNLTFSFNGVTDHFELAAGTSIVDDIATNGYYQPGHDQIWVKDQGAAASLGRVSVSAKYEL